MLELMVTPNPFLPLAFFVVIRMAPFAALEPYNAAAAGPLSTVMEATSSGLISPAAFP